MNMAKVRELVDRWIDERVERDSGAVTSSYDAFGDFLEWWQVQEDRGDGVAPYQFGNAMKQLGVDQKNVDSDWVIPGIKLKGD